MCRLCTIEDCGRPHDARGYCSMHWKRWQRTGNPHMAQPRMPRGRRCSIRGCQRPVSARGMCTGHVTRLYRWGDPRPEQPLSHQRVSPKRWPAVDLLPYVDSLRALARLLNMPHRNEARWATVLLTSAQADEAALELGMGAWEVWDSWLEAAA
jgi:hypothetical protein